MVQAFRLKAKFENMCRIENFVVLIWLQIIDRHLKANMDAQNSF
jgi:hypothetical protein